MVGAAAPIPSRDAPGHEAGDGRPGGRPRTVRPIILWTTGILLALALTWFVGVAVVPYFQARAVVMESAEWQEQDDMSPRGGDSLEFRQARKQHRFFFSERDPCVMRLGGPERAAMKLSFYMRLPDRLAPHRNEAAFLLGRCGDSATPALICALKDGRDDVRAAAADALGKIRPETPEAVSALVAVLGDSSENVRAYAAQSLGLIGSDSPEVIAALERLAKGETGIAHHLAVRALERIREQHPQPGQQSK